MYLYPDSYGLKLTTEELEYFQMCSQIFVNLIDDELEGPTGSGFDFTKLVDEVYPDVDSEDLSAMAHSFTNILVGVKDEVV